jgi:hypothetical protein
VTDKVDEFSAEETPTRPDRYASPCPNCTNAQGEPQGTVEEQEWRSNGTYRIIKRTCTICYGKKWCDRADLVRWNQRNTKI